jgi:hypothetical protein
MRSEVKMEIESKLNNTDSIETTISITMSLKDWKALKGQLEDSKWPECDLRRKICDMVYMLDKTFTLEKSNK